MSTNTMVVQNYNVYCLVSFHRFVLNYMKDYIHSKSNYLNIINIEHFLAHRQNSVCSNNKGLPS
jgi:hypothetical protein